MNKIQNAIRFRHFWKGFEPGQVNKSLDRGVMDTLVATGRAEWHEEEPKPKRSRAQREPVPAVHP